MSERQDSNLSNTYLGDGLYAEFDGYQVRLYTQKGDNVYLEPAVMAKLIAWIKTGYPSYQ